MKTEKSEVYSITGCYTSEYSPNRAEFFGGFFSTRPLERIPNRETPFNGSLIDLWGASEILGEISEEELRFHKRYVGSEDRINYRFNKNEKGLWVGEYYAGPDIGKGRAVAKTHLDWPNVNMILPPASLGPEEWAKNLVEEMVNGGLLEIVKNNKTGEEEVRPL